MKDPNLYPHQELVFDLLMSGKNVILQAPTGSGKTRAALYPFLYGLGESKNASLYNRLPRKCIYSVPMRVLANQFRFEYEKTVAAYNRKYGLDIQIRIQTGENPTDRELAGDLIFATIDQTLSSYLMHPYSLSRGRANLNAGAILSSYLVFDEFHLYDPISTLPTTLQMLQTLNGITPFVLMTATFSEEMLHSLKNFLNAEVVPGNDQERVAFDQLESQNKKRFYHVAEERLTADVVLARHQTRSLVICNKVDRARQIHRNLQKIAPADVRVILLHSRFLADDRNQIENEIRHYFGKDRDKSGSYIVVATQAIEVGVDITCENLHTELAPANAILQRAGRCARYPDDVGHVYVYRHVYDETATEPDVDLYEAPLPYKSQQAQFPLTWEAFQQCNGQCLTFNDEQRIISHVHDEIDRQIINNLNSNNIGHRDKMWAAMRHDSDKSVNARNLIRDINQQSIIIHPDPDTLNNPFTVPSFGLHPGTASQYLKLWLARAYAEDLPHAAWYLVEQPDPAQNGRVEYIWEPLHNPEDNRSAIGSKLIAIHPDLATYTPDLGFIPEYGGDFRCTEPPPDPDKLTSEDRRYTYRLETYETHIQLVYDAFTAYWSEVEWAAEKLEQRFRWEKGSVRKAAELAVWLHDVGKLSRGWQGWVRKYQALINEPVASGQAYAHTESQNDFHREMEKKAGKRPYHAVESAVASFPIVQAVLGNNHPLIAAVFSAIARHHSPDAENGQDFQLERDALKHIRAVTDDLPALSDLPGLKQIFVEQRIKAFSEKLISVPKPAPDMAKYLAYQLIVRVLRRADSSGTKRGSYHGIAVEA